MDSLHMANLRRAGDRLAEFHHTDLSEACRRAGFHIAELEAELAAERERREAAEKDAARYRWLRGDAPIHSERWPRWDLQRWDGRCWHSLERGALDAAIDAAMKD